MAEQRKKPGTLREMVEQLWYAMIGTNGDGEIEQNKLLRAQFRDFLQHRSETCPVRMTRMSRGQMITVVIALMAQIPPWIWIISKSIK
jgi:hypothetical protein